ncbi:hypothetical protein MPER_07776, partial [Moniliophthora perniciosa FA553]
MGALLLDALSLSLSTLGSLDDCRPLRGNNNGDGVTVGQTRWVLSIWAWGNATHREARELAEKKGEEGPHGLVVTEAAPSQLTWSQRVKQSLSEIDAFGLILLGFGWSLLLLPFSLKTYAKGGWDNPSLIAMMVVGVIDSFYFIAGQMRGLYLSSYVYVITDWRERDWVYFNNTMTLCLCIFGVIAGLILRWTHRYKLLQSTV